jgi:hypothetical protein
MIPFTRHALWRKVEEYRVLANSFSLSASPNSLSSSQLSLPRDPSSSPENLQATPSLAPSAPPPLAPTPPTPLLIPPSPVAVSDAHDYIQSIALAASGILDMQAELMQNVMPMEVARVIGVWRKVAP